MTEHVSSVIVNMASWRVQSFLRQRARLNMAKGLCRQMLLLACVKSFERASETDNQYKLKPSNVCCAGVRGARAAEHGLAAPGSCPGACKPRFRCARTSFLCHRLQRLCSLMTSFPDHHRTAYSSCLGVCEPWF